VSLTRVSPALFQVSNNITSVTVGGSANTISLTFDSNGVITGASNNAVSVANTAITGNIISSQITSVANTQITGNITAAQITSVANTQLTGLIEAAQIGSANATLVTSGTLPKARLPTGSVLQVVSATYSTTVTSSSTSAVSSGLTATITPTSSSSKIYVMVVNPMRRNDTASVTFGITVSLFRNASGLFTPMTNMGYSYTVANMSVSVLVGFNYLDSPATTSATTYAMYFNCATTGMSCSSCVDSNPATITLMEIAA